MKKILLLLLTYFFFASTATIAFGQADACQADLNEDGIVNTRDYQILTANLFKSPLTNQRADITGDGVVNLSDYAQFSPFFLKTCEQTDQNAISIYVSPTGSNRNNGSRTAPFQNIQYAVERVGSFPASPVIIHILPGIYRESITISSLHGSGSNAITLRAENGPGTAFLYGSESSQDPRLSWTHGTSDTRFPSQARSHLYWTSISTWDQIPELAFATGGSITRLPKAREPDWGVTTPWKYHENWWQADGAGSSSLRTLVDAHDDPTTAYPEASLSRGNLKTVGSLLGGRIFLKDTVDGHDSISANIVSHSPSSGSLSVDENLDYYGGQSAIGPQTKYFVEGAPSLLDQPGEWYVDPSAKRLYIWPPGDASPASIRIEFAVRPTVLSIQDSTFVSIEDLDLAYANYTYEGTGGNDGAIRVFGATTDTTHDLVFDNIRVRDSGTGIRFIQRNDSQTSRGSISGITLRNSLMTNIDGFGISAWSTPLPNTHAVISGLTLENNEFSHFGFRGSGDGIRLQYAEKLLIRNNYFHDMSHNAIEIQEGKTTSDARILVMNNLSENNCLNGTDCGAFKIWNPETSTGSTSILVAQNIFRGTKGWSYAASVGDKWVSPTLGKGYAGFGYYSDWVHARNSGGSCAVTLYRNLMSENSLSGVHLAVSRDQCLFANTLLQNGVGIQMRNFSSGSDASLGNKVIGNTIAYQETGSTGADSYGIFLRQDESRASRIAIDENLYNITGGNTADFFFQNFGYHTVGSWNGTSAIANNSPWETHGKSTSRALPTIPRESSTDITTLERYFGMNPTILSAVTTLAHYLEQQLGTSIQFSSTVGRP